MSAFEYALAKVFEYEGGYSDNPQDPGGETNHGISKRSFPEVDIRNLSKDEAAAIYEKYFWNKLRCAELPAQLAIALFDTAVNMGVYGGASLFQETLDVTRDGIIGKNTITAANSVDIRAFLKLFLTKRIIKYTTLTTFPYFGSGWIHRVLDLYESCIDYEDDKASE